MFYGQIREGQCENWEGHGLPGLLLEPRLRRSPQENIAKNAANLLSFMHIN